jgi:outer membrane immunogenic protein
MRKLVLVAGALALVSMSGTALADGSRGRMAYAPTAYNWSGVYFGGHLGYGWNDVDLTENLSLTIGGVQPPPFPLKSSHDADGWLGGVHLGAMKQFGSFVVGTELSLSGADINGNGANCLGITTLIPIVGSNCETTVNWLLTGLAKGGFAWDRFMVYGALGYAVAGVDHSIALTLGPLQANWSQQDVAHGVAYGVGFEYALSKDFMLGVQYLHADLEAKGEGLLLGGFITNGRRDIDLDTITARLSYKWGGDCCAPVPMK